MEYRVGTGIDLDAFIELYRDSSLGAQRPVDDENRMKEMRDNANILITAWDGDLLVGVCRSLSDFSDVAYLADLIVRNSHQRQGIGRELMRFTQRAAPQTTIVLLAGSDADSYYEGAGFTRHSRGWYLRPEDSIV